MAGIKDNLDITYESKTNNVWGFYEGVVYRGDIQAINDTERKETPISPLLAVGVLGLNNTATPSPETTKYDEIWTDIDAQEMYLYQKPTCYIVLGKPSLGLYDIGESISKKYHCIHLCPKNIINDEIIQGTLTGKCLDFNMKHNIMCAHDNILKILKQKIISPAVQHRGYVISGLPLVASHDDPYCLIKSTHSEEALLLVNEVLFDLICNLNKRKSKPAKTQSTTESSVDLEHEEEEEEEEIAEEQSEEEEEESVAELPKFILNPCSNVYAHFKAYYQTTYAIIINQLQELFNFGPDVVIYVTCPDVDVITKKKYKYINYKNGHNTVQPFPKNVVSNLRWPAKHDVNKYVNPHDQQIFNPKYNCRPPINFNRNSVRQICNYRKYLLPFIEKKLMDYNPKQIIKLDGRISNYQKMHEISERLLLMDVNPVIIPEPLYLQDPPEDLDEFWEMIDELNVIHSGDVKFNRHASPWYNRCPVELKKRRSIVGKPKFAVMLFKHVYLMSSSENFTSFCMNPRPYLKLQYLEPTCRIVIMGTKSSGKSMIAECLSWLFDVPITCYNTVLESEREKKYLSYSKTILSEISATLEDARIREWEEKENDRMANLNEWIYEVLRDLKKYIPILSKHLTYLEEMQKKRAALLAEKLALIKRLRALEREKKMKEKQGEETTHEHEQVEEIEEEVLLSVEKEILETKEDPKLLNEYVKYRNKLIFLPIDNLEECKNIVASRTVTQYAPSELTTITIKPPLPPVLGDADVTQAISNYIVANELTNEIEPTPEEIMHEFTEILTLLDEKRQQETNSIESYGKYIIDGFPSNSVFMTNLSDKLTPDYTIAIMESRELEPDLLKYYLNMENIKKNPYARLSLVTDPLVLCKLQTKSIPNDVSTSDSTHDDSETVHFNKTSDENEAELIEKLTTSLTESIGKFREEWDTLKVHLEDKSKCYIEIEIEEKTDIEILEEMFLKLRQCYYLTSTVIEDEEVQADDEADTPKDLLSYNNPQKLCETARRVPVPDERFDYLCEFHKPASKVPAFLNVVDIAGLVRGAAEGQGLGNAFLSHIKACDAIFNLCRAFDDEDVIHVDGDVNPVRDLETIGEELRLKDEEELMKNIEKLDRVVNRGNDKKLKPEYDTLQKIKTVLVDEKKHIRFGDWSAADIEILNKYLFLTSKPALYLVNLSEKDYIRKKNKWLPKLKEWIDKNDPGAPLIPFSGALEIKLAEMEPAERQQFLKENNLTSALDKIIVQGYKALQLEYFFTAGPDEVKAWTIQKGTKAPQAAGRIHTDFEKGFIMAEVMHYKDFKEEGTEVACKAAGKYRQQGRNYVVEDGDIIFFKFNAGAGLKDAKKK